ncbi:type II toxin-antitoxin system PemK/MazF family toxin [Candidatus Poriferisocius sp.]|uniref:type II toxin-antitoxin system PemK/MazF family toxin n=1 Tax=Candidatus Poriferisocius sp. TaxID=3101276 RepID=UPI003B01CF60
MADSARRGEVWWWEAPHTGRRPVVVLSRDAATDRRKMAIVAPCTTTIRGLPSEVLLEPGDDPVPAVSAVNLDSVENAPLALLVQRLGRLSDERMREVCAALEVAVDCI